MNVHDVRAAGVPAVDVPAGDVPAAEVLAAGVPTGDVPAGDARVTERYLDFNRAYAERYEPAPSAVAMRTAVVACMDARLDVHGMLGLRIGDAHVIRNGGGVVTDDVMRSLVLSQRLQGTTTIVLIHHTECGMLRFTEDEMLAKIEAETGSRPSYAFHPFADIAEDVRAGMRRIRSDPHLPCRDAVRGFIADVATGLLEEVV